MIFAFHLYWVLGHTMPRCLVVLHRKQKYTYIYILSVQALALSPSISAHRTISIVGREENWIHEYIDIHINTCLYYGISTDIIMGKPGQYTHQNKHQKGLHHKMLFLRHNLNISGGWYSKNSDTPKPTRDLRLRLMHVHTTMITDGISRYTQMMIIENTNERPFDPDGVGVRLIWDVYFLICLSRN